MICQNQFSQIRHGELIPGYRNPTDGDVCQSRVQQDGWPFQFLNWRWFWFRIKRVCKCGDWLDGLSFIIIHLLINQVSLGDNIPYLQLRHIHDSQFFTETPYFFPVICNDFKRPDTMGIFGKEGGEYCEMPIREALWSLTKWENFKVKIPVCRTLEDQRLSWEDCERVAWAIGRQDRYIHRGHDCQWSPKACFVDG